MVALWEGPQLLLAKVKDADGQDWYNFELILMHLCWLEQTIERNSKIESPYFDLFVTRCENLDKTVLDFFENDCP